MCFKFTYAVDPNLALLLDKAHFKLISVPFSSFYLRKKKTDNASQKKTPNQHSITFSYINAKGVEELQINCTLVQLVHYGRCSLE